MTKNTTIVAVYRYSDVDPALKKEVFACSIDDVQGVYVVDGNFRIRMQDGTLNDFTDGAHVVLFE